MHDPSPKSILLYGGNKETVLSGTWIRGIQNQRLKRADPRGIRALKPLKNRTKAPPTRIRRARPTYIW
jgi:hypothetical protein